MRKRLIVLGAVILSSINFLSAQITFQKAIGGTGAVTVYGKSVEQTTDGGYIIAGYSNYSNDYDVYLIKTNANGDTLWTKTFGNGGNEYGYSVQQTSDGGYVITGSAGNDVYLIKTNANGNVLWAKTYGGSNYDIGSFVRQTSDGGYIITGGTQSFNQGDMDVYLIRTDGNGDTLWTKTFRGTVAYIDVGYSVEQTTDGGFIITGAAESFGAGDNDVYLIKTDGNGNLIWSKTYGGTNYDDGFSVQQTTDGGYVIAGRTNSFGSGDYDVYLIKTDASGDTLWSKTYGGADDEEAYSVQQTTDGGYIITGITGFGGYPEVYLIKTDANGVLLWSKRYGDIGIETGYSVKQTTDGGYVIAGVTQTFVAGFYGVYFIKTDSLGNSGCNEVSPPTIEITPPTQLTIPATVIISPPTIVTTASTITGSNGIVTTLCTTVGINEITTDNLFLISPNPSTGNFIISFKGTIIKGTVEILNTLGENVFEQELPANKTSAELNLSFLQQGVYFLNVKTNGESWTKKIVKM